MTNAERPGMGTRANHNNEQPPATEALPDQNTLPGYFVPVPVWLFGRVSLRSVGVYTGLLSFAFGAETCSPTEAEVAQRLGVSVDTIARWRKELVASKAVKVAVGKGATGGRYVYTFRSRPAGTGDGWARVPVALLGRVSPAAVGLYGVLRSFEGDQGCYPAIETVADRAAINRTQGKDYLRELRRAGAIEALGRVNDKDRTTSNLYHFPDPGSAARAVR